MSFDLMFWHQESVPSSSEAAHIYDQLTDGLTGVIEGSPAVSNFYQSLISTFPDLTEENMNDSPWTSPIYVTSECVIVTISWARSDEVSSALFDLASKHRLTVYNPQDQSVHGIHGID